MKSGEAALRAVQRRMLAALLQPLTAEDALAPQGPDGRPMAEFAAAFLRPNERLTAFERLQIYARSYWFRLLDCVYDDAPGLRAVLGEARFAALARAYLAKYPSRSFTLRNLCARLPQFILEEPALTAPRTALAHAVARFEWAQTVAFDAAALPALTAGEIAPVSPGRWRVALQPHVTLLALDWPVDDYLRAIQRRAALRSVASQTRAAAGRGRRRQPVPRPRRRRVHLVVHRWENRLYYKRLAPAAFAILAALAAGRPLAAAVAQGGPGVTAAQVRRWFATWMELGWLCRCAEVRPGGKKRAGRK